MSMGHSLISGSSSVRVTTQSSLRTWASGRHWSWSRGWSTLQSGDWQDTLWNVQLGSEEVHTLVSQGVVVVLPRELGLDVTLGGQRLQGLDHVQVSGVNFLVLWLVKVLLSDDNTLLEEVLVDLLSVFLWNQHDGFYDLKSNSGYLGIRGSKIFRVGWKFLRGAVCREREVGVWATGDVRVGVAVTCK